jgi:hypothetical protein
MSREDLEGEGLLVLVRCCNQFPKGEERFARYFKRALYNHLKNILRFRNQEKRKGREVSLDIVSGLSMQSEHNLMSELRVRADLMKPYISPLAYNYMVVVSDLGKEVSEVAWQDFCRRNKLNSLGIRVQGWKKFRIKARHVRKVLDITPKDVRRIVKELRMVNSQLNRRNNLNGQEIRKR